MREIKYQVWYNGKMYVINMIIWYSETNIVYGLTNPEMPGSQIHVGSNEAQRREYTGLLDKNGKEIYEGDIVIDARWDGSFEVKWCDGKGEFLGGQLGWILDDERFCEVAHTVELEAYLRWDEPDKEEYYNGHIIGNIYENTELLEAAK